jgi:hypothetical protein
LQHTFVNMLSEIVKKQVEQKTGQEIRYPRDCTMLAEKIFSQCNCRISASTLRRLFGFDKSKNAPRDYTLDIIAQYIGYPSWGAVLKSLNSKEEKPVKEIMEVNVPSLKRGEKLELAYKPNASLLIEYIGNTRFKVLSATNSRLKKDEIFKANLIAKHRPMFVLEVEGRFQDEKIIEGKVSGITHIRKV